ncbi:hypothetical protein GH714_009839 [Hevea brasiliensis]|uniref:Uncharacterized protein n=1 Tax=Hevea brasiliensis TaxID=3981 RepID=A0A6A6KCG1_HEVBR|nr:hypothetical protein GH714_009817 [Hevea brasiliensis]KAF2286035.1 hypothetical protein GH714_009839 [Hevea brasiliensis]
MKMRGMIMEDFSGSSWQKSDNSRGLSTSRVSDWNRRPATRYSVFRKETDRVVLARHNPKNQVSFFGVYKDEAAVDPFARTLEWGDVSLRQWLDKPERSIDEFDVYIYLGK